MYGYSIVESLHSVPNASKEFRLGLLKLVLFLRNVRSAGRLLRMPSSRADIQHIEWALEADDLVQEVERSKPDLSYAQINCLAALQKEVWEAIAVSVRKIVCEMR